MGPKLKTILLCSILRWGAKLAVSRAFTRVIGALSVSRAAAWQCRSRYAVGRSMLASDLGFSLFPRLRHRGTSSVTTAGVLLVSVSCSAASSAHLLPQRLVVWPCLGRRHRASAACLAGRLLLDLPTERHGDVVGLFLVLPPRQAPSSSVRFETRQFQSRSPMRGARGIHAYVGVGSLAASIPPGHRSPHIRSGPTWPGSLPQRKRA